jgi:hypothetical protein
MSTSDLIADALFWFGIGATAWIIMEVLRKG